MHIMLIKVPIMLCSNFPNQANYAHCFVPIVLLISHNLIFCILICDNSFGNLHL